MAKLKYESNANVWIRAQLAITKYCFKLYFQNEMFLSLSFFNISFKRNEQIAPNTMNETTQRENILNFARLTNF